MSLNGGCYCGKVRYVADGEPTLRAQCHCRECQYISGGGPNFLMMIPASGFTYAQGTPREFTRADLPNPVTRQFCGECGTHLASRVPGLDQLVLKAGTLDEPAGYGAPEVAIYLVDRQPFHVIADGIPKFERLPQR